MRKGDRDCGVKLTPLVESVKESKDKEGNVVVTSFVFNSKAWDDKPQQEATGSQGGDDDK